MSTGWRPKPPTPTAPVTAVAATVMAATRRGGGGGDGPDRRGGGSGETTTEATAIVAVVVEMGAPHGPGAPRKGERSQPVFRRQIGPPSLGRTAGLLYLGHTRRRFGGGAYIGALPPEFWLAKFSTIPPPIQAFFVFCFSWIVLVFRFQFLLVPFPSLICGKRNLSGRSIPPFAGYFFSPFPVFVSRFVVLCVKFFPEAS